MKLRLRFAESDRDAYGDGWYECEVLKLDWDREGMTGLVERFEDETGYALPSGLLAGLGRGLHRPMRALAWWIVLLAGHDVRFADFDPRLDLAEAQWVGGEGNRQGPQARAKSGTGGHSAAKRSASTSRTAK